MKAKFLALPFLAISLVACGNMSVEEGSYSKWHQMNESDYLTVVYGGQTHTFTMNNNSNKNLAYRTKQKNSVFTINVQYDYSVTNSHFDFVFSGTNVSYVIESVANQ